MSTLPVRTVDGDGRVLPPRDPELLDIWLRLDEVVDPEIPVLTIRDLGVLRGVREDAETIVISITPTYSGCPAMDTIGQDIKATLRPLGRPIRIETVLHPPWTTDWLSEEGREKLREYGIAPPAESSMNKRSLLGEEPTISCPRCHSTETTKLSEFGSTACKALYTCSACHQPFDYFKCI